MSPSSRAAWPVIVVDDAIAHFEEALAGWGDVVARPGRSIDGRLLAELGASVLVTRSVTRVDRALLVAAPGLRFVGTATAGVDHVDRTALAERDIGFAHAPGCNARAVAEWVAVALSTCPLARELGGPVGIVGFGNVGRRLAALLRDLEFEVLACDPPLARAASIDEALVDFETLWSRCSVVSFHVPLTRGGTDPTFGMLDRASPRRAGPKLIVNTSRGPVVRDRALDRPDVVGAILDVWDGEPQLSAARLRDEKLLVASPHVAGYSLEAKLAATRAMHEAVGRHLGRPATWTGTEHAPPVSLSVGPSLEALLHAVVDLPGDDRRTRALADVPDARRASAFESLRRGYALRREFGSCIAPAGLDPRWGDVLRRLQASRGVA